MESTVTGQLATFVCDVVPPDDVRHVARRALATVLPLAAGAADQPGPRHVRAVAGALGTPATASVLGTAERTSPVLAACANGTAANSDDFDDTDLVTAAHPSAAVVPAALALAEWSAASVADLTDAVAKGIEVGMRLARALGSAHVERGWHISSTSGQLAAGTAAAATLDLGADDVASVVGLSATQVAGLGCALGTMTKPFHFGKAAANGVEAALLVQSGLRAPRTGIEGRRGLMAVVAPGADTAEMLRGLGESWVCRDLVPKPYPCGFVAHPVVDAALALAPRVSDVDEIVEVRAEVHRSCLTFMATPEPRSALEAKLSAPFCIAAALGHGRLGLSQFADTELASSSTRRLMSRTTLAAHDRSPHLARLTVRTHHDELAQAIDGVRAPLTDAELRGKGVESAARTLSVPAAESLVDACLDESACSSAAELARAATTRS